MTSLTEANNPGQANGKHVDSMLMYCSYFSNGVNGPQQRRKQTQQLNVRDDIILKLHDVEKRKQIPQDTCKNLETFYLQTDDQQRQVFDAAAKKKQAEAVIRGSFQVVQNAKADPQVVSFVLANLDGILEDKRSRVKLFANVMTDWKDQLDLIGILNSFLHTVQKDETKMQQECAAHILALLIEEVDYQKCSKDADEFLDWLTAQRDLSNLEISITCYSFCLLTLLKTNELAQKYSNHANFTTIGAMLDGPCLKVAQVGYNVGCMLWILSYHPFARQFFQDYTLALIEKTTKILDFNNWEKIARILLLIFDNLKEDAVCQDHFSDIDAHQLIIKLQNRHWVDEDINNMLEKLFTYFDENQKVFSSIDKLKNQVKRQQLRWGPCHTEKFWQENIILFDKAENLSVIREIVSCLDVENDMVKSVACFDLGEFSKFYHHGREFLDKLNVKQKMAELMSDPKGSAAVKKEAITCYQKLLMDSWSQQLL